MKLEILERKTEFNPSVSMRWEYYIPEASPIVKSSFDHTMAWIYMAVNYALLWSYLLYSTVDIKPWWT